jgi:hypothetical protein
LADQFWVAVVVACRRFQASCMTATILSLDICARNKTKVL